MFETKKVMINDNGMDKQFTITALPARSTMHLMREISMLFTDTDLIHSLVLQQFIHKIASTGVEVEGADPVALQQLMAQDLPLIITNLIKSVMSGLTPTALDALIDKCLCAESVIYHNGKQNHSGVEALDLKFIQDFAVIMELIYEVFLMNFGGVIERIKKLLAHPKGAQEMTRI